MVLGARNFSKRHVKENTPPSKTVDVDAITQRVTASLREAARRRRRRVSGGKPRSLDGQFEVAQKRDHAKSRSVLHFRVVKAPVATVIQDTEMSEPQQASTSATIPMTVPRRLQRPTYKEISREALQAAAPGIENVEYIRETLPLLSSEMLRGVLGVKVAPITNPSIPKQLEVDINPTTNADIPTHLFAVYRQQPTKPGQQPAPATVSGKVMIHPVHSVMMAAHCANLPPLTTSPVQVVPTESGGAKVTLPVKPLGIPVPELFPLLSTYLYTKRSLNLLMMLLPSGCIVPEPLHPGSPASPEAKASALREFGHRLAQTYTPRALVECIAKVNGLWQNVCALGVFDVAVWEPMDIAWEILLTALSVATNQPQLMLPCSL